MTEIILPTSTLSSFLPWAVFVVGVIWIIYSIIITLHWINYAYNSVLTAISLSVYYIGSLAIIGYLITFL
jgi:hypothetical protein